ncbi:hypothetical protein L3Q82_007867 [Scortum barcoo]|uniref:Uncharacterized protein n=1 Tax=Scortum barcoo TaxID=214431 RepID=A0ACB8WJ92_9TELE|nr:hypothetical protein L3Q82_007867 [Scortum barcoo]
MSHREEAQGRPRTRWRDYVSQLDLGTPQGSPQEELEEVSGEKCWAQPLTQVTDSCDVVKPCQTAKKNSIIASYQSYIMVRDGPENMVQLYFQIQADECKARPHHAASAFEDMLLKRCNTNLLSLIQLVAILSLVHFDS